MLVAYAIWPVAACACNSAGQCLFTAALILLLLRRDYTLQQGQALFVYGSTEQLGSWQESRAVALTETATPLWQGEVTLPCTACPVAYRCGALVQTHTA